MAVSCQAVPQDNGSVHPSRVARSPGFFDFGKGFARGFNAGAGAAGGYGRGRGYVATVVRAAPVAVVRYSSVRGFRGSYGGGSDENNSYEFSDRRGQQSRGRQSRGQRLRN